jgi:hypothetical protein
LGEGDDLVLVHGGASGVELGAPLWTEGRGFGGDGALAGFDDVGCLDEFWGEEVCGAVEYGACFGVGFGDQVGDASDGGGGTDVARALRTRAERISGGGWRITGEKMWTSGATLASHLVVLARTTPIERSPVHGVRVFLVPARASGVDVRPLDTFGIRGLSTCQVVYDDVVVATTRSSARSTRACGRCSRPPTARAGLAPPEARSRAAAGGRAGLPTHSSRATTFRNATPARRLYL